MSIVPRPREIRTSAGFYHWPQQLRISFVPGEGNRAAEALSAFARSHHHEVVLIKASEPRDVDLVVNETVDPTLGDEGYSDAVAPDGIRISANTGAGLFYGVQTLLQLTSASPLSAPRSPLVLVRDWPRFRWRGIHLDVSRNYFSLPTLKRFIDIAARYKLNTFHWHLTDNEAWRLQIRSRPLLTERGACAADGAGCGYYSKEAVRELVSYARDRYITIVPEIDIPGHSAAAVRAYPYLSCSSGAQTALCPSASTFHFLDDVLSEVVSMFPGPFVQLGGDEVDVSQWRNSQVVQDLLRTRKISSVDEVPAFIRVQCEKFLAARGRRVVVWDDALAGPVQRDDIVMAWRGLPATALAVGRGHDTVVSSDGPLYFDGYQGDEDREPSAMRYRATLQQVYRFEPISLGGSKLQAQRVLGVQANLWTEQVTTPSHLFYMLLPRELALAELAWTPPSLRSWRDFETRLPGQLDWMAQHGYSFRIPDVSFSVSGPVRFIAHEDSTQSAVVLTISRALKVALEVPVMASIRYTTDGSTPTQRSPLYTHPFDLRLRAGVPIRVTAAAFLASRKRGPIETCEVRLVQRFPTGANVYSSWPDVIGSRSAGIYVPPRFP
jgi:hexosaminidase